MGDRTLVAHWHAAAQNALETALSLNRYGADTAEQMGHLLAMRGKPVAALEWIDRAMRLNPIVPPQYHFDRAHALYNLGEYQAAAEALTTPARRDIWHEARLAACCAQLGEADSCREALSKVFAVAPDHPLVLVAREQAPFEHTADVEHLVEGFVHALQMAGHQQ